MNHPMTTTGVANVHPAARPRSFPVGFHAIHPNVSINFQMNRWYNWTNDEVMLSEMYAVAPQIHDYADVRRIFCDLSDKAQSQHQVLRAAFYLRMAEFFMFTDDPAKLSARNRFVKLMTELYEIPSSAKHLIPYQNGNLVAYRFSPERPKSTIVAFGGFDSYVEEFFPILTNFRDAGYDIICFEGPGQGGVLEAEHLPRTPEWERPVQAVLDHFHLADVTLIGVSLGGYLVLRAAAYEPRVKRAIAWDVIGDALECSLGLMNPTQRRILRWLLGTGAAPIVNRLAARTLKSNLMLEWAFKQAMHVMGASTPYEALRQVARYHTRELSPRVRQDVLLLAGAEDHYVPLHLFHEQVKALTHVRSLTARLFTREEQAHNHCQIGNLGLVLGTIQNWIDQRTKI